MDRTHQRRISIAYPRQKRTTKIPSVAYLGGLLRASNKRIGDFLALQNVALLVSIALQARVPLGRTLHVVQWRAVLLAVDLFHQSLHSRVFFRFQVLRELRVLHRIRRSRSRFLLLLLGFEILTEIRSTLSYRGEKNPKGTAVGPKPPLRSRKSRNAKYCRTNLKIRILQLLLHERLLTVASANTHTQQHQISPHPVFCHAP